MLTREMNRQRRQLLKPAARRAVNQLGAASSYRGVNRARRFLYRAGVLKAKRLHRPVISIGNLAAGGAGKTPAVIAVCALPRGARAARGGADARLRPRRSFVYGNRCFR
jgi:tetraacyldisaccharide-1-P 4'-kinase